MNNTPDERPSGATRIVSLVIAIAFIIVAMTAGYTKIGLPPVVIVGGSGIAGCILWVRTYLSNPVDPRIILPPFLLTVAALEVHMIEEYSTRFGPAMSRLFDISWSQESFLLVFTFIGPILYSLTALGLYYRVPISGFLAWFIFIGPGVAEFSHFIFPLLKPAIHPDDIASVSQAVSNGKYIAEMPNYYFRTTGSYYFSGLYTAVLPMIPGIFGIYRMLRTSRERRAPSRL
jgi:hypothetical protein